MKSFSHSIMLTALLSMAPTAVVLAQNPNPGNSGGPNASVATPTYEDSTGASNPALTTGTLPKGETGLPANENPTVRGATGDTIVRGDRSTISGDRRATIQQKSGEGEEGGGD